MRIELPSLFTIPSHFRKIVFKKAVKPANSGASNNMLQVFKTSRWLKFAALLLVPLVLYAVIAECSSWRPRVLHYRDEAVAVAYSPDGRWLVCLSASQLEVRDAQTERIIWHQYLNDPGKTVAFAPDSQNLAVQCLNTLQLWNVPTHKLLHSFKHQTPGLYKPVVRFTPNDSRLIVSGNELATVVYDTRAGKLLSATPQDARLFTLARSSDSSMIALITSMMVPGYIVLRHEGTIQAPMIVRPLDDDGAFCATFTPDQKTLAIGTRHGKIMFWDIATRRWLHQLTAHSQEVSMLVFSPDGSLLASSSNDGVVKLWDA